MLTSPALLYKLQRAELLEDGSTVEPTARNSRRSISPFRASSTKTLTKSTTDMASSSSTLVQDVDFQKSMERMVNNINKNTETNLANQDFYGEDEDEEKLLSDQRPKQKAFSTFLKKKAESAESSVLKIASSSSKSKTEPGQIEKSSQRIKSPFRRRNVKLSGVTIDEGEALPVTNTLPNSSATSDAGKTDSQLPHKTFSMFTLRQGNKKSEALDASVSSIHSSEPPQAEINAIRHKSPFRSRNGKLSGATISQGEALPVSNTMPAVSATVKTLSHMDEEVTNSQSSQNVFSMFALKPATRKFETNPEAPALPPNSSELPQGEKISQRYKSPFRSRTSKNTMAQEEPLPVSNNIPAPAETIKSQDNCKTSKRSQKVLDNVTIEGTTTIQKKSSRSSMRKTRSESPAEVRGTDTRVVMEGKRGDRTVHTSSCINKQNASELVYSEDNNFPQSQHGNLHRSHQHKHPSSSRVLESYVDESPSPFRRPNIDSSPSAVRTASTEASPSAFRRASIEARTRDSSEWLRFMGDIVMWRHVPRSAFLFGFGFFISMSASRLQTSEFSVVSMIAYVSLAYLAATYIKSVFLRGGTPPPPYMLTEADALRLIRLLLPPLNSILMKMGEIFSGEPTVTLKVAGALWLLAQFGSRLNVWTLTRIAYFSVFTLPKCYSSYNEHIERHNSLLLAWVRTKWSACGRKKVVLALMLIVAWSLSSVPTRICGAFLMIVAVKAYWNVVRESDLLQRSSNILNFGKFGNQMTSTAI